MQHKLKNLNQLTVTQLIHAIKTIPIGVTSLNLHYNDLGKKTGAELAEVLAAIPTNVTSLNLKYNALDNRTGAELAQTLSAIPTSVISLNLSTNGLGRKTGAELAQALAAIPASVTSFDLSSNGLQKLPAEELNKLSNSLPCVQTIYLSETEIKVMTPNKRAALKAVFSKIQNIILLDNNDNALGGNDLEACHYFAGEFGLTKEASTLKSHAAFFVKHHIELSKYIAELPEEVQEFVNKF